MNPFLQFKFNQINSNMMSLMFALYSFLILGIIVSATFDNKNTDILFKEIVELEELINLQQ